MIFTEYCGNKIASRNTKRSLPHPLEFISEIGVYFQSYYQMYFLRRHHNKIVPIFPISQITGN